MGKLLSYLAVVVVFVVMAGSVQAKDQEKKKGPGKKVPAPEKVFAHKDKNGDGKLTIDEFLGKIPEDRAEKAKARFTKLDADASGDLSLDEFKAGFGKKGKGKGKPDGEKKQKKPKKDKVQDN